MSPPKLSSAERSILINQFRILAVLEDDVGAYQNTIDVLESGYELEYEEHLEGFSEPLDEDQCKFVRDVLWLYCLMKLVKNKEHVDNNTGERDAYGRLKLELYDPKFPGFDGNSQPQYYGYAKFLIEKNDSFIEHSHYLNSHGSQPNYQQMLDTWENWGRPLDMTEEQVDELLGWRSRIPGSPTMRGKTRP